MPALALVTTQMVAYSRTDPLAMAEEVTPEGQQDASKQMKTLTTSGSSPSRSSTRRPSFGPLEKTKMVRSELALKEMHSCPGQYSVS